MRWRFATVATVRPAHDRHLVRALTAGRELSPPSPTGFHPLMRLAHGRDVRTAPAASSSTQRVPSSRTSLATISAEPPRDLDINSQGLGTSALGLR